MKIINYFSKDITDWEIKEIKDKYTGKIKEVKEPMYSIVEKQYKTSNKEFKYWLDVIQKTYGEFGEITTEDVEEELTSTQIALSKIENLGKELTISKINNIKKDKVIDMLGKELTQLKIKVLEEGK